MTNVPRAGNVVALFDVAAEPVRPDTAAAATSAAEPNK
jgi:hypothetical protein